MKEYQLICGNCQNTFFGELHETICFWCQDDLAKQQDPKWNELWWEALEHQRQKLLNPEEEYNVWFNPAIVDKPLYNKWI